MVWEGLLQAIVNDTHELIIVFDDQGKAVYQNEPAKIQLDYGEKFYEATIEDVIPKVFRSEGTSIVGDWEFGGESREIMLYRGNRTCFPAITRIIKYENQGTYYVCYAYDASEKNYLEKKVQTTEADAKEALKVKSEFVSNITHELKTPVNGILGNAQSLMEMETDPEKIRVLNLVERGCKDMQTIIGNVLDFSKLEAGKFLLEPRKFKFRDMIDYIKSNHIHKITEKGLDFIVDVSPEVPEYVVGDELRLTQVINNLISNAVKFTHVGKIMVEVVKTAQIKNRVELFFFVIDTGIGIAKEDQSKLFNSFTQVDASISRQYGGTGLGLNICRQLVQLMDGDINLESTLGEGSVFSFHVWMELPEEEVSHVTANVDINQTMSMLKSMTVQQSASKEFGTAENLEEIKKKMSKLVLCMEMENWEKAEMFVESIKALSEEAPKEVKTTMLRLKMAIQKEDYDKAIVAFDNLKEFVYK